MKSLLLSHTARGHTIAFGTLRDPWNCFPATGCTRKNVKILSWPHWQLQCYCTGLANFFSWPLWSLQRFCAGLTNFKVFNDNKLSHQYTNCLCGPLGRHNLCFPINSVPQWASHTRRIARTHCTQITLPAFNFHLVSYCPCIAGPPGLLQSKGAAKRDW